MKWRMWADHGVEFFIHPAMQANRRSGFRIFSGRIENVFLEGRNSGNQVEIVVTKSDAQKERTAAQMEGFARLLPKWTGR
jgi:hypothetical protein